jgi:uncharacterized protein YkwD
VPKRPTRRILTSILGATLLAAMLVPAVARPAAAADGASFAAAANARRTTAGVGPVAVHATIDQIAIERGNQIAAAQQIGHDFPALIARFAQLGVCWNALGEIVAMNSNGSVETFITQWMNSTVHRGVMLDGNYTHVGGYSKQGADGRHYGVMVFARVCGSSPAPVQTVGPGGFYDTHGTAFGSDISWLVESGITTGCATGYFCPKASVTREQMASFLKRAIDLPSAPGDYFVDDWASVHQDDINRLAFARITGGCSSVQYCPSWTVTREQMAAFLVRALGLESTDTDYFWDDEGSPFEGDINAAAAAGITGGCGGGRYCTGDPVTREQMAAFLHRAFD